ncbi:hypothetical protein BT63DRAFT_456933 [Microthyrium microscopicum]|uniref:Uncharacterized protein n=1 Tax=Microthyrium microscopicum TaxID=703497 RepID=A0A6A6U8K8_9PEZI|nr:hypothetical protein BT63DRAFT_456933 [Microthyrium microscopicum]
MLVLAKMGDIYTSIETIRPFFSKPPPIKHFDPAHFHLNHSLFNHHFIPPPSPITNHQKCQSKPAPKPLPPPRSRPPNPPALPPKAPPGATRRPRKTTVRATVAPSSTAGKRKRADDHAGCNAKIAKLEKAIEELLERVEALENAVAELSAEEEPVEPSEIVEEMFPETSLLHGTSDAPEGDETALPEEEETELLESLESSEPELPSGVRGPNATFLSYMEAVERH